MAEVKYKTKQREEILRFFMNNKDECFSARDVCAHVSAGEATVFRTISALTNEGKLKRFKGDSSRGESAFYRYNSCSGDGHIHLMCEDCGALIHADCTFIKDVISHFSSRHGFSVDCEKTVIYGLCTPCRERREKHETDN